MSELPGKVGELQDVVARLAHLRAVVRDREAEILRIQTHETSAAHVLDSQLSPEERAQFKALADVNARLRAANERLRALIEAEEHLSASRFERRMGIHSGTPHKTLWDAYVAARRAVDEAGDLRET